MGGREGAVLCIFRVFLVYQMPRPHFEHYEVEQNACADILFLYSKCDQKPDMKISQL